MAAFAEPKDKVLVFDIWGDYAHYRNIETTTSPLTYSIPTGTALAGMVSAIVGLPRDSYYGAFSPENARFAICRLSPLRKTRINMTQINTSTSRGFWLKDAGESPRTLVPCEFVKDPKYRIYAWIRDENFRTKLRGFLREHKSYYTPCLGTANLIANFAYVGEYGAEKTSEELIHSVARMDNGKLQIEENKRYTIERIPTFMNQERVTQDYAEVVYEVARQPVRMSDAISYRIGSDNVVFL